jgi:hypothetical protein
MRVVHCGDTFLKGRNRGVSSYVMFLNWRERHDHWAVVLHTGIVSDDAPITCLPPPLQMRHASGFALVSRILVIS